MPEEIDYLELNHAELSIEDIGAALGRTPRAVQAMSYKLGLELKIPRWTEEETVRLRQHYHAGCNINALCALFPGRTRAAVLARVDELALLRPAPLWSDAERAILRRYYPEEGGRVALRVPGRSKHSLRIQAKKQGIRYRGSGRYRPWSAEELALLARSLHLPGERLCALFPAGSKSAILSARGRLRRKHL